MYIVWPLYSLIFLKIWRSPVTFLILISFYLFIGYTFLSCFFYLNDTEVMPFVFQAWSKYIFYYSMIPTLFSCYKLKKSDFFSHLNVLHHDKNNPGLTLCFSFITTYSLILLSTLMFPLILCFFSSFDWGVLVSGYLGCLYYL